MGKWNKVKFFKTSLNNKNSNSLSHKKLFLIIFFAQKVGELWLFFLSGFWGPQKSQNFGFLTLKYA